MTPLPNPAAQLSMLIEAEVERFKTRLVTGLRFAPSLEERFRRYCSVRWSRFQFHFSLLMLVCFDLFLIGDWFVVREHFAAAMLVRLGIVTPVSLVLLQIVRNNWSRWSREVSVVSLAFLMCAATLILAFQDNRTVSMQAEPTVFIMLVVVTGLLRVEMRYCLGAVIACVTANSFYMARLQSLSVADRVVGALPVALGAMMMLAGSWLSWRQIRLSYLLQLRGEQQSEMLSEANYELRRISDRDELTGVGSRYAYERESKRLFLEAARIGSAVSIVMVDVDHFKAVNDKHGHQYGDRVLQRVGALIQQALREERDFAARYGGEEFIVLLPETEHDAAMRVAERIRTLVQVAGSPALTRESGIHQRFTTVSCGVATMEALSGREAQDVVEFADRALYAAKANGRNRVESERSMEIWKRRPVMDAGKDPRSTVLKAKTA